MFSPSDLAVEYRYITRNPIRTERQEEKLHYYDYDQLQTFLTYLTDLNYLNRY